ncbi:DNA/RNA nuclease SfsA [Algicella marina]|uniref:Sugar fermentation stimulation protein homolog n=1 Tax=Algicella marina TaxID=2683284 RepID=A0A6P1T4J4_9RHOB|nr:DNA/RNA nuclease SfsA [Algicella marina]QHQ36927.1 DNA/RNA nuclease SfsA [Algicella marina]
MIFDPPLIRATLLRRYKRFLADVTLEDGQEVVAHCANPGRMTGVNESGSTIWLQPSDNPNRKLKFSWKLIELPCGHLAGIDTGLPNVIVEEALSAKRIPGLSEYETFRREVRYRQGSRVDFLLQGGGRADCYLEVKNVHLRRKGTLAEFPDSVTARGAKHMGDLMAMAAEGHRAVVLYVVQRTDCTRFSIADDIDPVYADAALAAKAAGVETLVMATRISTNGVSLADPLSEASVC